MIQVDSNGQMYYIDENGMMVMIPFGGKIKRDGWMVILKSLIILKETKSSDLK